MQAVLMTEETRGDNYYSPRRVKALLRQIPYFYARRPTPDDELGIVIKRSKFENNAIELRMAQMGDLLRALERLSDFDQRVIWICVVFDQPYRVAASHLGVSESTISRTKDRAIEDMAFYLGYSGVE